MQVTAAMDLELELNLQNCELHISNSKTSLNLTCQLVAVKGTREKIHPCCDGRSFVRRMYLVTPSILIVHFATRKPILISADYGVPSEVEPAALEIGIEVRLSQRSTMRVRFMQGIDHCKALHPHKGTSSNGNRIVHTGERLWVRSYGRHSQYLGME